VEVLREVNFHDFLMDGGWDRLAVFLEAGQISLDSVPNIRNRFVVRLALRHAPRQIGALRDEHAVLILRNENTEANGHIRIIVAFGVSVNS